MGDAAVGLADIWQGFVQFISIVGGLGVFIFGMKVMSDGLQKAAGNRMQRILDDMTGRPGTAILTGLGITSLLQSSSATTVMVVSVVNAGLLSLTGAVGVIMGANIGTTLTAWIVSALGFKLSVSSFALPIIAIGFPLLISSRVKNKGAAEALVGFGILFIGLGFLKDYMATDDMKEFIQGIISGISLDSYFLRFPIFVLLGTILTVLVQSSSAAMTITLTLISIGALNFEQGAMIVLGENIGTTITAFLASLGANLNAKRASRVHLLFNLFGVAWMFAAFYGFTWVVTSIIPDGTVLFGNSNSTLFQLSLFHSLFNIVNTLILVWFTPQLVKVASALVKSGGTEAASLRMLNHGYQEVSDGLLFEARKYLTKMAGQVGGMIERIQILLESPTVDLAMQLKMQQDDEDVVDQLEEELSVFLTDLSGKELSPNHHREISGMLRAVSELEKIGDGALAILSIWSKLGKKKLVLNDSMKEGLHKLLLYVKKLLAATVEIEIERSKPYDLTIIHSLQAQMARTRKQVQKSARNRLKEGANVRLEMLFLDIANSLEHVGGQIVEITNYGREEEIPVALS